jgi:hypothetical protein
MRRFEFSVNRHDSTWLLLRSAGAVFGVPPATCAQGGSRETPGIASPPAPPAAGGGQNANTRRSHRPCLASETRTGNTRLRAPDDNEKLKKTSIERAGIKRDQFSPGKRN